MLLAYRKQIIQNQL